MANRRMIDSNLFEDDFIGSLEFFGRFLWIGLFSAVVDDQGRCADNPAIIRARVFPFDQVSDEQVEGILARMANEGKILRYQAGMKRLIQVMHWWDYQQPSWASESKYPAPEGWTDRVKYHGKGNKIILLNWEHDGGFERVTADGSALPSPLPSGLPSPQGRAIEEYEKKNESESESESEQKQKNAPAAQKSAAAAGKPADGEIFRIFEQEIGPLTPMVAEVLKEIEVDYPAEWFRMACREAVLNNARNMKYVKAILARWKVQGLPSGGGPPGKAGWNGNGHKPSPKYDTSELDGLISAGGAA